jgi:hypothetical protein
MAEPIFINADNEVSWTGATANGSYLNSATVTYALKTITGATVSGGTGTLSYVAASNGNYLGTIESTVTTLLTEGTVYLLQITLSQSSYNDFRQLEVVGTYRENE